MILKIYSDHNWAGSREESRGDQKLLSKRRGKKKRDTRGSRRLPKKGSILIRGRLYKGDLRNIKSRESEFGINGQRQKGL